MQKAKIKLIKDTKHQDVAIYNGEVFIGFVEIDKLVNFLKNESIHVQELSKR